MKFMRLSVACRRLAPVLVLGFGRFAVRGAGFASLGRSARRAWRRRHLHRRAVSVNDDDRRWKRHDAFRAAHHDGRAGLDVAGGDRDPIVGVDAKRDRRENAVPLSVATGNQQGD